VNVVGYPQFYTPYSLDHLENSHTKNHPLLCTFDLPLRYNDFFSDKIQQSLNIHFTKNNSPFNYIFDVKYDGEILFYDFRECYSFRR